MVDTLSAYRARRKPIKVISQRIRFQRTGPEASCQLICSLARAASPLSTHSFCYKAFRFERKIRQLTAARCVGVSRPTVTEPQIVDALSSRAAPVRHTSSRSKRRRYKRLFVSSVAAR